MVLVYLFLSEKLTEVYDSLIYISNKLCYLPQGLVFKVQIVKNIGINSRALICLPTIKLSVVSIKS